MMMMMNELRGVSEYGFRDVTMIARLMTEYFVVVSGNESPYENLSAFMAAIKADPGSVAVGAASDQIAERNHFTTFAVGSEFQSFLEETQADVKTALNEGGP